MSTTGASTPAGRESPSISRTPSSVISKVELNKDSGDERDTHAKGDSNSRSESQNDPSDAEYREEERHIQIFTPIYSGLGAGLAFGVLFFVD